MLNVQASVQGKRLFSLGDNLANNKNKPTPFFLRAFFTMETGAPVGKYLQEEAGGNADGSRNISHYSLVGPPNIIL